MAGPCAEHPQAHEPSAFLCTCAQFAQCSACAASGFASCGCCGLLSSVMGRGRYRLVWGDPKDDVRVAVSFQLVVIIGRCAGKLLGLCSIEQFREKSVHFEKAGD